MLSIRFSRKGKKKQAIFRVIVCQKTKDPWGDYLENLGWYNPRSKELELNADRIKYWLDKGAQPSDSIWNLLVEKGLVEGKKRTVTKLSKKRLDKQAAKKAKEEPKVEVKPEEPKVETKPAEEVNPAEPSSAAKASDDKKAEEKPAEEVKPEEPKVETKPAEEDKPAEPSSAAKASDDKKVEDKPAEEAKE